MAIHPPTVSAEECAERCVVDPEALKYIFGYPEFPTVGAAELFAEDQVHAVGEFNPDSFTKTTDEVSWATGERSWALDAINITEVVNP